MERLYSFEEIRSGIKRRMKTEISDEDMEQSINEVIDAVAYAIYANNLQIIKLMKAYNKKS